MGTPQRAILKRSNARSCFEPRRSRDPAAGRYARKPTNGGRAFWRPPTGPRDATSNTRASASDPHSGQYARVGDDAGPGEQPFLRGGQETYPLPDDWSLAE